VRRLILCLTALVALHAPPSVAQRCGATCADAESLLGVPEESLLATIPEIERLDKPEPGPRNALGKWVLRDLHFATQSYRATYFIHARRVSRIEYLQVAAGASCAKHVPFDLALTELEASYGKNRVLGGFQDDGKVTQSAAFNTLSMDIALHFSVSPDGCSTRIVFKPRELKDAAEL